MPREKKLFLILIVSTFTLILAGVFIWQKSQKKALPCSLEAKICPDGSSVGRTGPNCEFAPCPQPSKPRESGGEGSEQEQGGTKKEIKNFEDCAAAGGKIRESYPRQCQTPEGSVFIEELSPEERKKLEPSS